MVPKIQVTDEQVRRMAQIIKADARKFAAARNLDNPYEGIMVALLRQMGFDEGKALCAAQKDQTLHGVLTFLASASFRPCEVCCEEVPDEELTRNALRPCRHTACASCLKAHFQEQAKRGKLQCMQCSEDIPQSENLGLLKRVFRDGYEEFDETLLNRGLEVSRDVEYCVNDKCGAKFSVPEGLTRLQCPICKTISCAFCRSKWRKEHEGRKCDEFKEWKRQNDPDDPDFQSQDFIKRSALACPNCKMPYFKAMGGCAHFTCSQCKHQFCECCKTRFARGRECGNEDCKNKGMHGHHPRNCFFYTRDYPIEELVGLLKEKSVVIDEAEPTDPVMKCSVNMSNDDFQDSACGKDVLTAGKCIRHYKEMICDLIVQNGVDILSLMNERQLQQELVKNGKPIPEEPSEGTWIACLRQAVANAVPLQPARN